MDDPISIIMSALSTLTQPEITKLTLSLSSDLRRHRRRISAVVSSKTLFTQTLNHLHQLSLSSKTTLLAKHLLSSLRHLTPRLNHHRHVSAATQILPGELDGVLLLLFLCKMYYRNPEADLPLTQEEVMEVYVDDMMSSEIVTCDLIPYVEAVASCMRFVVVTAGPVSEFGGGDVAASVGAVVALPSVEAGGGECMICREEMGEGRDVCRVTCGHVFHWKCVLRWLQKRNTCPYCRFQLPTDDVFGEIRRLWDTLVKMGGSEKE